MNPKPKCVYSDAYDKRQTPWHAVKLYTQKHDSNLYLPRMDRLFYEFETAVYIVIILKGLDKETVSFVTT